MADSTTQEGEGLGRSKLCLLGAGTKVADTENWLSPIGRIRCAVQRSVSESTTSISSREYSSESNIVEIQINRSQISRAVTQKHQMGDSSSEVTESSKVA